MFATSLLRRSCLMVLVASFLLQAGCVYLSLPLSQVPESVDKDKWEGTWDTGQGEVMSIHFDTKHVARMGSLNWIDGAHKFSGAEMVVTKGQRHNYLSMRDVSDDLAEQPYLLAQYTFVNEGREVVIWRADPTPFFKAVKDGMLEEVPGSTNTVTRIRTDVQEAPGEDAETPGENGLEEVQQAKRRPNRIALASPPEKILEFLENPKNRHLFLYDEPIVWRKIVPPGEK